MTVTINDRVKINPQARRAIAAFRASKPWRGSYEERFVKFDALRASLADAYGLGDLRLAFVGPERTDRPGDGAYWDSERAIVLMGKLSVVTFLHVIGRARGKTGIEAQSWAISVFKRMFPISYAGCRLDGFMLVR